MTLSVTERAAEILHKTLQNVDHDPDQVLRLVAESGGLSLALDEQREEDQVIEFDGDAVLVLEPEVREQLDGITLDFAEGPDGGRLTLNK